jgi:hypothetical protein
MTLAYDYYKTGNRSALFNHVADAKRWGVAHNVPVICNEFGAYARTSRVVDRIRYYTDIVSIFQELQIPWQTLYPVMDADGNIVPRELRAAFGFDDRPNRFGVGDGEQGSRASWTGSPSSSSAANCNAKEQLGNRRWRAHSSYVPPERGQK